MFFFEYRPTDSSKLFYKMLKGEANSPRAGNLCYGVKFAVFGLCNSLYSEHFNTGMLFFVFYFIFNVLINLFFFFLLKSW